VIPILETSPDAIAAKPREQAPDFAPPANGSGESEFLRLLRTVKKQELAVLAKLLMPFVTELDMRQMRIWGDRSRVHLERATVAVNDLLMNTRSGHVTIEADCFFGHRCMLLTGTHDYSKTGKERLYTVPDSGRDIHVKQGVWMGSGVTVLGPAVIGENAVIAAGSLVVGDVPANTIMAGHPAKPVKSIDGGAPHDRQ
jgi:acetyltransferase-like isoleucine patch superfamily enzyme